MLHSELSILNTLLDTLPSGLLIFEVDGKIIRINQRAKALLGLEQQDAVHYIQNFPEYLQALCDVLLNRADNIHRAEITVQLPLQEDSSILGYSLTHFQNNQYNIGVLIFSDITQVVQDRLALDRIQEELNQSKNLASLGTLIAGVAHELNNPLTGISMSTALIQMNLERLKQSCSAKNDGNLENHLEKALSEIQKIGRANEKAATLVNDLLSYSKPTQLVLSVFSIQEIMQEFINAINNHPQFSSMNFDIQSTQPHPIRCDRVKLEQVLYNLFKNASDATDGHGSIRLYFSETEFRGMPALTIHIQDNGPGIDSTILNRIFDPFFTTKGHHGVGLGLSISYRTIEQHGGQLAVESTKGVGTEFKITLPLYLEEEPTVAASMCRLE